MDYCSVEDIESRFLNIDFTSNTSVSTADVESFISLNSAEIDGRLESDYTVPITGTQSLQIIQKICIYLTLSDVHEILEQKLTLEKGATLMSKTCADKAEKMLRAIEDGAMTLSDAESLASDAFVNSNNVAGILPVMKKDTRQW